MADVGLVPARDPTVWTRHRDTAPYANLILATIGEFYAWVPRIKPQLPDLDRMARRAVFWLPSQEQGVVSRGLGSSGVPSRIVRGTMYLPYPYQRYVRGVRPYALGRTKGMKAETHSRLGTSLGWSGLNDLIKAWMLEIFPEGEPPFLGYLRPLLEALKAKFKTALRGHLSEVPWSDIWSGVEWALEVAIKCAIVAGEPQLEFQRLFALWFGGNYPVGLDVDERLIVLTASRWAQ